MYQNIRVCIRQFELDPYNYKLLYYSKKAIIRLQAR